MPVGTSGSGRGNLSNDRGSGGHKDVDRGMHWSLGHYRNSGSGGGKEGHGFRFRRLLGGCGGRGTAGGNGSGGGGHLGFGIRCRADPGCRWARFHVQCRSSGCVAVPPGGCIGHDEFQRHCHDAFGEPRHRRGRVHHPRLLPSTSEVGSHCIWAVGDSGTSQAPAPDNGGRMALRHKSRMGCYASGQPVEHDGGEGPTDHGLRGVTSRA